MSLVGTATFSWEKPMRRYMAETLPRFPDLLRNELEGLRPSIPGSQQALVDKMDPSDPTYQAHVREVLSMQIEYKNWVDLMQADVARETGVWTANIYREMLATIKELAERDGLDAVLYRDEFEPTRTGYEPDAVRNEIRGRKLVYWNPATDLSARVADKLNEAYRKSPPKQMIDMAPGAVSTAPPAGSPPPAPTNPGKKP